MKSSRLESKLAKVKFKGIDGNQHKRWSVWLNLMQREEPYQNVWWCMADVSSCCEIDELHPFVVFIQFFMPVEVKSSCSYSFWAAHALQF